MQVQHTKLKLWSRKFDNNRQLSSLGGLACLKVMTYIDKICSRIRLNSLKKITNTSKTHTDSNTESIKAEKTK